MSKIVNIHAAKTNFSKLCEEVEAGGQVTIARAGKPILRLVKIEGETPVPSALGWALGLGEIYDEEALVKPDLSMWGSLLSNEPDPLFEV
jgi:prevent-host-death family protein